MLDQVITPWKSYGLAEEAHQAEDSFKQLLASPAWKIGAERPHLYPRLSLHEA